MMLYIKPALSDIPGLLLLFCRAVSDILLKLIVGLLPRAFLRRRPVIK